MQMTDVFQSKYTVPTNNDYSQIFISICEKVQFLEEKRIAEKLVRPTSAKQKRLLMNQINSVLQGIKESLIQIKDISAQFKGKITSNYKDQIVSASAWKNGIRRSQAKITLFYQQKMRHFDKINDLMSLDLHLVQLEQKQWAKECISKMNNFCICG